MAAIQDIIALAIKRADTVIQAVQKAGYEIVPIKAPEGLVPYVHDNMPFGRHRPSELVTQLYTLLVTNARRFDK